MSILLREDFNIDKAAIVSLYESNYWSSAEKPDLLFQGLMHSHALVTAWDGEHLVGLGNSLSDGFLVVYYPHLLIHPAYQGQGIGRRIMDKMREKYGHFHQQILVADGRAVDFYQKCGFVKAGETQSMWIYQGTDHEVK